MVDSPVERLRQQVSETYNRMQEIQARADAAGWTAEDRTNWDAANDSIDTLMGDLQRAERTAALGQVDRGQIIPTSGEGGTQPNDPDENRSAEQTAAEYRAAFSAYLQHGLSGESPLTPRQRELLAANRTEARALGQGAPQGGGFLVPLEYDAQVREIVDQFGGMLQYCHQITTATGAALNWPLSDDTMNEGVEIAENTQVPEQDLTFDTREIGSHIYTSKMVRVPWSLSDDAAFDLDGFLIRKFGERLGRVYAKRLLTGTGNGQPLGLLTLNRGNRPNGVPYAPLRIGATAPAGATPSITLDNLVDLEHSIDPAYRNSNRARYMISDGTLKLVRKLKDADGRPLWVPIPAPGFAPTINGHPYFVDNTMADPAVGNIGAAFGDFYAGMLVRIVQGFQAVRLTERFADFMQTGYFAYSRMDATPDDPKAIAALKFGAAS